MSTVAPTTAPPAVPAAERRHAYVALAGAAALILALFADTLLRLLDVWRKDPNYSHGLLILPLSLGLAWHAAGRAGWPKAGELRLGLTFLLVGCFVHLPALLLAWPPLDFIALVFVLRGLAVAAGGRAWADHFLFPTLFLFFMFPLPISWTSAAAVWLQDLVTAVSGEVLSLFVVCYRSGNTLTIAGVGEPLVVASECSGLRQIVAFVALAAFLGYFYRKPVLFRVLLLVAAVPVAILANVVRVVLMGLGARLFGTGWIRGWLHDAPAMFTLVLGLVLFMLVGWLLGKFWPDEEADEDGGSRVEDGGSRIEDRGNSAKRKRATTLDPRPSILHPPSSILGLRYAVVCLAVGLLAQVALWLHVRAAGAVPYETMARGLDRVPLQLKGPPPAHSRFLWLGWLQERGFPVTPAAVWRGRDAEEKEIQFLRETLKGAQLEPDDLLLRAYVTEQFPFAANVYMIHSRTGEDRKHHPEVCIRDVAGRPEDVKARATLLLDAKGERRVQRFRFLTGTNRHTTVYYWHYTFLPPEIADQTLLQSIHQRLSRPAPSVTVQVSTEAPPEALPALERSLLPALDSFLLGNLPKSQIGCARMAISIVRQ